MTLRVSSDRFSKKLICPRIYTTFHKDYLIIINNPGNKKCLKSGHKTFFASKRRLKDVLCHNFYRLGRHLMYSTILWATWDLVDVFLLNTCKMKESRREGTGVIQSYGESLFFHKN